jgi:hypothetical protein
MLEMIKSLSLESGALLIAVISGVSAFIFSFIDKKFIKWFFILLVPFLLAYFIYWSPVWFGSSLSGEYSTWEWLVMPIWCGAGLFTSVTVCFVVGKSRKHKSH